MGERTLFLPLPDSIDSYRSMGGLSPWCWRMARVLAWFPRQPNEAVKAGGMMSASFICHGSSSRWCMAVNRASPRQNVVIMLSSMGFFHWGMPWLFYPSLAGNSPGMQEVATGVTLIERHHVAVDSGLPTGRGGPAGLQPRADACSPCQRRALHWLCAPRCHAGREAPLTAHTTGPVPDAGRGMDDAVAIPAIVTSHPKRIQCAVAMHIGGDALLS